MDDNFKTEQGAPSDDGYDFPTAKGREDVRPLGPHPGDRLVGGRYEVIEELGRGAMGVVYRCLDCTAGIEVALKALPPELSHNTVEMEEVRENFQLVSHVVHQSIAVSKSLELDKDTGDYYLVMEYVKGENLRNWMHRVRKERGNISLEEALPILRQMAEALDYAHDLKVMHRDIKPSNVMLTLDGKVKVMDFGLAAQIYSSLTHVSRAYHGTSGTRAYMAPEQWRGKPQGASADQYALAVMAYEMLAGRLPFDATDIEILKHAVLEEAVEPIKGVPAFANSALRRALSKESADRFPSCAEFVKALGEEGAGTSPLRRIVVGVSVVAIIAVLVGTAVLFASRTQQDAPTPHTRQDAPAQSTRQDAPAQSTQLALPATMAVPLPGGVQLELIKVEAGSFVMGSLDEKEKKFGRVTLTKDFMLGKFEVTQEQYMAVMRTNPSWEPKGEKYPVTQVNWNAACAFCAKVTRLEQAAGRLPEGYVFDLPTEAQWEFAARGGKLSKHFKYCGSNNVDDVAWYYANAGREPLDYIPNWKELKERIIMNGNTPHPVGEKLPNELGFYDMSGNVWEWCLDKCDFPEGEIAAPLLTDAIDPCSVSGSQFILRGGCFFLIENSCSSVSRFSNRNVGNPNSGFRVALVPRK